MDGKRVLIEFVKRRPDAPRSGYFVTLGVAILFVLAGHDEPVKGLWPYFFVVAICVVQLLIPTIAGWLPLIAASAWYALRIGLHPAEMNGQYFDYAIFLACGAVPAVLLAVYPPWACTKR